MVIQIGSRVGSALSYKAAGFDLLIIGIGINYLLIISDVKWSIRILIAYSNIPQRDYLIITAGLCIPYNTADSIVFIFTIIERKRDLDIRFAYRYVFDENTRLLCIADQSA